LDEATSALDNETEKQVVEVLNEMKGRVTSIIVAHRLSTLSECDLIYKLKNGSFVQAGLYNEIIKSDI
jgi:ABC-type bacteriocin/lantibiotic exporter with double-glycine peptidase domain